MTYNWNILAQWLDMVAYIWVNTGSGNDLLPDGFLGFRLREIAQKVLINLIRNMCAGIKLLNYYHISQWMIS